MKSLNNTQLAMLLDKMIVGLGEDAGVDSFVKVVTDMQATGRLDSILNKYMQIETAKTNLDITSAYDLSPDMVEQIKVIFDRQTANLTVNKGLLGGVVIKTDKKIYDVSVAGQIDKLSQSFKST